MKHILIFFIMFEYCNCLVVWNNMNARKIVAVEDERYPLLKLSS